MKYIFFKIIKNNYIFLLLKIFLIDFYYYLILINSDINNVISDYKGMLATIM